MGRIDSVSIPHLGQMDTDVVSFAAEVEIGIKTEIRARQKRTAMIRLFFFMVVIAAGWQHSFQ